MYILSTGCQWASLPEGPAAARSTVNDYFCRWNHDGTLDRIHHALYVQCRELAGKDANPTAAIIDSQKSVKSAEKGAPRSSPPGFDAEKRSKARERHVLVDTQEPAAARRRTCGRHPGPRRWRAADGTLFGAVPFLGETLRRRRLPGAEVPGRSWPLSAATSTRRSSGDPISGSSWCCPNAGSSKEPLHGSTDVAAWHNGARECLNQQRSCVPALGFRPPWSEKLCQTQYDPGWTLRADP